MFDIDGTLMDSMDLDGEVFFETLDETFGFPDVSTDWGSYRDVTDTGILDELFAKHRRRAPTATEVDGFRAAFFERLARAATGERQFRPIAGAHAVMQRLLAAPDVAVAYASGGFGVTARYKLRSTGFRADDLPGAYSEDGPSRVGIMRAAHQRAREHYGDPLDEVVYVGDARWDVIASRKCGYRFIGVGTAGHAERLRAAGATIVIDDFRQWPDRPWARP